MNFTLNVLFWVSSRYFTEEFISECLQSHFLVIFIIFGRGGLIFLSEIVIQIVIVPFNDASLDGFVIDEIVSHVIYLPFTQNKRCILGTLCGLLVTGQFGSEDARYNIFLPRFEIIPISIKDD
jgi:hypothetical protein